MDRNFRANHSKKNRAVQFIVSNSADTTTLSKLTRNTFYSFAIMKQQLPTYFSGLHSDETNGSTEVCYASV